MSASIQTSPVLSGLHHVTIYGSPGGSMEAMLDEVGPAVVAGGGLETIDDDDDRVLAIIIDGDVSSARSVTMLVTEDGRRRVSLIAERLGYAVVESAPWRETAVYWSTPPLLVVRVTGNADGHVVVAGCLS